MLWKSNQQKHSTADLTIGIEMTQQQQDALVQAYSPRTCARSSIPTLTQTKNKTAATLLTKC